MSAFRNPLHLLFADLGLSGPVLACCARFAEGDSTSTSSLGSRSDTLVSQVFISGYEFCREFTGGQPLLNNSPQIDSALEKLTSFTAIFAGASRIKEALHLLSSASVLDNKFHKNLGILSAVKQMSLSAINPKMNSTDKSSLNDNNKKISVHDDRALQLYSGLGLREQTRLSPKNDNKGKRNQKQVEEDTPWSRQVEADSYWDRELIVHTNPDDIKKYGRYSMIEPCKERNEREQKRVEKATLWTRQGVSNSHEDKELVQNKENKKFHHIQKYSSYSVNPWFSTGSDSSDGSLDENLMHRRTSSHSKDNDSTMDDACISEETPVDATADATKATIEKSSQTPNQNKSTKCVQGHCIINGDIKPEGKEPTEEVKEKEPKEKKRRWLWFVFFFIRKIFGALLMALKYVLAGGAMAIGLCEMIILAFYGIIHYVIVVPIYNWTNDIVPWLMSPTMMEEFVLPAYSKVNKAYQYQSKKVEKDEDSSWFQQWLLGEDE